MICDDCPYRKTMFDTGGGLKVSKCTARDFLIFPDYPEDFGMDCQFADV